MNQETIELSNHMLNNAKPLESAYRMTAIEYTPSFDLKSLNPQPGDIIRFYINEKYSNYSHPPISHRMIYGSTYYAPDSDISAISSHFGCLFQYHKRKSLSHKRLNTVRNALEIAVCGEAEYARRAVIVQMPVETRIKGVVVTICVDFPPAYFPQCKRNGFQSRELQESRPFSLRVAHFWLVSDFDEPIELVNPENYVKQQYQLPPIKSLDGLSDRFIVLEYNQSFLKQFFTRLNIVNGLFMVYRVVFESSQQRFELTGDPQCNLIVQQAPPHDMNPNEIVKRKDEPGEKICACELYDMQIMPHSITFKDKSFDHITSVTLYQILLIKSSKKDKLS